MGVLIPITDQNLPALLAAECAVLILTKSDCGHCARYAAEIEALGQRGAFCEVPIGKLVLDQRGAAGFKRANPWVAAVDMLPFTLLFRAGERVDAFAASRATYLLERIEESRADVVA